MFSVSIKEAKNRIYIQLGEMGTGDGEKLVNEIKEKTAMLSKGFTCVSDIINFSITDPKEAIWADTALKTLADAGMVRAVRVTGQESQYKETKEKLGYTVSLSKTIEEAEKVLDAFQNFVE
ncbi:MAG: hypothetical protein GY699_03135 [Desulfobacteraceae bacterium]|nr:hypothetical protein [Desulfobacteraceae bacterium]